MSSDQKKEKPSGWEMFGKAKGLAVGTEGPKYDGLTIAIDGSEIRRIDDVHDDLYIACGERGDLKEVQFLIKCFKPNLDEAQEDDGWTCLQTAAGHGRLEIVKFLVEVGADINKQDFDGWTPLHAASANGHLGVCRYLCENSADLSIKTYDDEMLDTNYDGLTPTQVASSVRVREELEGFVGMKDP
jgi:ankyrin repeat protein